MRQVDGTGTNTRCPRRRRVNLFNELDDCIRPINATISKAPRHDDDIECINLIERVRRFNPQLSGVINHRAFVCSDKEHIESRDVNQRLEWTNNV
jgi:hypothetical protein